MRHIVDVTDSLKGSHPTHIEPIAVDLAKHGFQVHDITKNEDVAFNHAIQCTIHTCHSILAHSTLARLIVDLFPYARNRTNNSALWLFSSVFVRPWQCCRSLFRRINHGDIDLDIKQRCTIDAVQPAHC